MMCVIFNTIQQTVDVEITATTPLQRACGAGSQVRNESSNGPLRAQSNERSEYSATEGTVTCRGYDGILLSVRQGRKARWHRG